MQVLKQCLKRIDQKGYKAYKEIQGTYQFANFQLHIDYVQGDPFASPSKIRITLPCKQTEIRSEWTNTKSRKVRCEDLLARKVQSALGHVQKKIGGSGKSGIIWIDAPGQKIIERTAVRLTDTQVTICLSIGLPANGRRILAKEAEKLFFQVIPSVIDHSVYQIKEHEVKEAVWLNDQQETIRAYLKEHGYIAFIGNGAILPRSSGVSDRPMTKGVIPFQSPKERELAISVPHQERPVVGMGIKKGITVIVGGGYHGKSTLLQAIEHGVYDHIEGDGREYVISDDAAVKIRAEDGRSISNVDISPFIGKLPYEKKTENFSTENASGSTSQAANIIEMLEAGATTLLIDEDTSATNFMIRDARMQALIAKNSEPITPFVDKVGLLKDEYDVSTILVMGGSGDYFDVADRVIKMEQYVPFDVTDEAKKIAETIQVKRRNEGGDSFGSIKKRIPVAKSLNSKRGTKYKVSTRGKQHIQYGTTDIHLQALDQLVDESQTRMIAECFSFLERNQLLRKRMTVKEILSLIEEQLNEKGIRFVSTHVGHPGDLALPRRFEIASALNRLRTLECE
ncbi:ABC-ATPase domain-containing protein [Halalkalibacter okhensis]|uniref:ABC transporter ATPase n=1 Tax=Halalkalibacter okhensis TaxID=333138 RepID=A0A0B0IH26_9BACI|nr:ABC-ATPase domain-containing protein [Halalkalibacter okhensis]KHF38966.1 ABC transporter ATPase [Halalkalibacter okhensis]